MWREFNESSLQLIHEESSVHLVRDDISVSLIHFFIAIRDEGAILSSPGPGLDRTKKRRIWCLGVLWTLKGMPFITKDFTTNTQTSYYSHNTIISHHKHIDDTAVYKNNVRIGCEPVILCKILNRFWKGYSVKKLRQFDTTIKFEFSFKIIQSKKFRYCLKTIHAMHNLLPHLLNFYQ